MNTAPQDWAIDTGSAMVSIGTHCLYTSISGPPRTSQNPIVVVLAGAGDVASSYTALSPLVALFSRILLYDRSGLGRSEPKPSLPGSTNPTTATAVTAAEELHSLLIATNLRSPLVLVAHSYGAIVAREYLHLYNDDVAGIVFADGSTERQCDYFELPDTNINAVLGDLKVAQVTGLRMDSKLSRDEWRDRAIDIARGAAAAQIEVDSYVGVCHTLAEKKQFQNRVMGSRPVSVIRCNGARDFERIYEKGVEAGNGTPQQQRAFRDLLDRWEAIDRELKEEQLQLSSTTNLVHLPDCGHNVHLIRPDIVADEIRWVLDQLRSPRGDALKL
ncbi:alpha/beta hydrolase fold protein [Penicillium cataractarum]|uniref:Alpha/beta hydrolase fold protein n=1 Tax=Penicillium cataractarum TaxID=2100454 RepID=A0A9W9RHF0_9EURO|nr:alpha/beta hydrolase fold protein [Penicillium cataractarum]KAJ5359610.1 alpha/beta hydrolase fold protein [Penicillium cataractarum]